MLLRIVWYQVLGIETTTPLSMMAPLDTNYDSFNVPKHGFSYYFSYSLLKYIYGKRMIQVKDQFLMAETDSSIQYVNKQQYFVWSCASMLCCELHFIYQCIANDNSWEKRPICIM